MISAKDPMKNAQHPSTQSTERKPAGELDGGVLDSLGKAITAPITGAAEDELLSNGSLPPRRESRSAPSDNATSPSSPDKSFSDPTKPPRWPR